MVYEYFFLFGFLSLLFTPVQLITTILGVFYIFRKRETPAFYFCFLQSFLSIFAFWLIHAVEKFNFKGPSFEEEIFRYSEVKYLIDLVFWHLTFELFLGTISLAGLIYLLRTHLVKR